MGIAELESLLIPACANELGGNSGGKIGASAPAHRVPTSPGYPTRRRGE
jgi:hypothetical protein